MAIRRTIRLLYAYRFLSSLIPAYVIERLYWEERGMTVQMVVWTEIIYAVTIVLLEVPTGIIADRWSRRNMIVIGAALGCCEFLILLAADQFWHFAAVVFLAGIARSASSGAENALLYDSLLAAGREDTFERLLGRLNATDFAAAILAALAGSLLAGRYDLSVNYWLSAGAALLALVCALLLAEPAVRTDGDSEPPIALKTYVSASLRFFRHHPGVTLVVLSGMATGAALGFLYEFWQLYLERVHVPVVYFGLFSAAFLVLELPGNLLADRLGRRFGVRAVLIAATAIYAAGFLCVSLVRGYPGIAAMLAVALAAGVVPPLAAGYLHRRIDSGMRATMDSFASLGENGALIFMGLGFGFFAARHDIFGGYGFIAAVCTAFFLYFALASRRAV